MTSGQEILRAFLLALGSLETITNLNYLINKNGINLARKQHKEIPRNISDKKMKIKVICMLLMGIAFFGVSLSTYLSHNYFKNSIIITTVIFSVYGVSEALYYRYRNTFGFAALTIIILICSIVI
ncbi:MAG: hypothetical protein ACYDG2_11670 [Ruminiclostridium sp.]